MKHHHNSRPGACALLAPLSYWPTASSRSSVHPCHTSTSIYLMHRKRRRISPMNSWTARCIRCGPIRTWWCFCLPCSSRIGCATSRLLCRKQWDLVNFIDFLHYLWWIDGFSRIYSETLQYQCNLLKTMYNYAPKHQIYGFHNKHRY